jgi:hypothetical protein
MVTSSHACEAIRHFSYLSLVWQSISYFARKKCFKVLTIWWSTQNIKIHRRETWSNVKKLLKIPCYKKTGKFLWVFPFLLNQYTVCYIYNKLKKLKSIVNVQTLNSLDPFVECKRVSGGWWRPWGPWGETSFHLNNWDLRLIIIFNWLDYTVRICTSCATQL